MINLLFQFWNQFISLLVKLVSIKTINNDAPEAWQLGFQDTASPNLTGIIELHNDIFYFLIVISLAVFYILGVILVFFNNEKAQIVHKYTTHGTLIELIWTITPAIVLMFIAQPSFTLLYILDEVIAPIMTFKAVGHQWFWSYELTDYETSSGEPVEFESYLVPESDLESGQLRLLDVDSNVKVPTESHIRVVVQSTDVLHDYAIPSLGVKLDAVPGRLNQGSIFADRDGEFYGQCSEICGLLHGYMPISLNSLPLLDYLSWVNLVAFPPFLFKRLSLSLSPKRVLSK